jgi:Ca2+/H+ antiporter
MVLKVMSAMLIVMYIALLFLQFSEGAELKQQQGEEQVSWGFDDDAVNDESGSDASGSDIDEDELPEYLKTAAQKAKRRDLKVNFASNTLVLLLKMLPIITRNLFSPNVS